MPSSPAELAWLRAALPGFTDEMLSALWDRAVEDTCVRSHCWQTSVTYDLPANESVVVLIPPVASAKTIWVGEVGLVEAGAVRPVMSVSPRTLETVRVAGGIRGYVWARVNADMIELLPTSDKDRQIVAQVALAPTDGSMPQELQDVLRRAVEARVMFLAHTHPTWPHANAALAAYHDRVWASECIRARIWGRTHYGPREVVVASPTGVPL